MNDNTIKMIPLDKLAAWKGNVRKTQADAGIDELAESIAAHGLLQSLVVSEAAKGKHKVIAGGRRLLALQCLAKAGRIDRKAPVPCSVSGDGLDPTEISLAENVVRVAMHPADQFEAFKKLIEGGSPASEVASRFGVSETLVQQRLKLGKLSKAVLAAYRDEEIDLEQAKAFAITDDHAAQERVLEGLAFMHGSPLSIRRALTEGEAPVDDRRVAFIGLDAYLAAGGGLRRDLFAEFGDYLTDTQLLDRLVSEKLSRAAAEIKLEGWSWVEVAPDRDFSVLSQFSRRTPEYSEPSEQQRQELDELEAERDQIGESEDDSDIERCAEIEARIEAIWEATECWPSETLAAGGAIVYVGHDGSLSVERGLVRKGDLPGKSEVQRPVRDPEVIPASLVADLTAQKTAALQAEVMARPDIALAATVYTLGKHLFYGVSGGSALQMSARATDLSRLIACPENVRSLPLLDGAQIAWNESVPDDEALFWAWCLEQKQDRLLALLAFIAARSIDAVMRKDDINATSRLAHAGNLADATGLDMSAWFTTDAAGYFSRVSSAQIIAALCEAKGTAAAPSWSKMKKPELAKFAERELAGSGWLPKLLRSE